MNRFKGVVAIVTGTAWGREAAMATRIDVRIDGDQVTISAETKAEKQETDQGRVIYKERQEGYASRSFSLACPVDEVKAEANYKDGLLSLKLPKKAATSTKRLAIQ